MEIKYLNNKDRFLIRFNEQEFYFDDYRNQLINTDLGIEEMKSRAVKRYKEKTSKDASKFYLKILPTNKCQLSCKYCFSQNDRNNEMLDIVMIKNVLEKIKLKNNEITIAFTGGGEPTLNFNLIQEVVSLFNDHSNVNFNITTNGIFDDEVLHFLIKNKFKVAMSVDGIYEMAKLEQKKLLNNSLYQKAIGNALKLKEQGIDITLLSVIMLHAIENNPKVIVETVSYFVELGFDAISISLDSQIPYMKLTSGQLDQIIDANIALLKWKKLNQGITIKNQMVFSKEPIFNSNLTCAGLYSKGKSYTILPNGSISFCHRVQEKKLFNTSVFDDLHDAPLFTKVENEKVRNAIDKVKEYKEKCRSCIARQICMAHVCPAAFINFYNSEDDMEHYCNNIQYIRKGILNKTIKNAIGG